MQFLKYIIIGATVSSTIMASVATIGNWGVHDANHSDGIQMRQESIRDRTRVFPIIGRSHRGGGLRGGK